MGAGRMIARSTGDDYGRFPLRRCPQDQATGVIPPPFDNVYSCFWSQGTEYIDHGAPLNLSFDLNTPFSLSIWFKTDWAGSVMSLLAKRSFEGMAEVLARVPVILESTVGEDGIAEELAEAREVLSPASQARRVRRDHSSTK